MIALLGLVSLSGCATLGQIMALEDVDFALAVLDGALRVARVGRESSG